MSLQKHCYICTLWLSNALALAFDAAAQLNVCALDCNESTLATLAKTGKRQKVCGCGCVYVWLCLRVCVCGEKCGTQQRSVHLAPLFSIHVLEISSSINSSQRHAPQGIGFSPFNRPPIGPPVKDFGMKWGQNMNER